jgi:hypothetical protein
VESLQEQNPGKGDCAQQYRVLLDLSNAPALTGGKMENFTLYLLFKKMEVLLKILLWRNPLFT